MFINPAGTDKDCEEFLTSGKGWVCEIDRL